MAEPKEEAEAKQEAESVAQEIAPDLTQAEAEAEANVRSILERRQQELDRRRQEFELEQQRAEIERLKEWAAQAEAAQAVPVAAVERTYVVQGGDTLSGIALTMYGDASRWSEIFEANRDQLNNPNLIYVGQALRIP